MATNFPASLDSLTNPTSSDSLNSPSHSAQHANVNDAVEALQAKVGVDSSAVTTSHDYLIDKQSVVPYADSSARTTAVPSPVEGQMSYLEDTNSVEVYDGSAWVRISGNVNEFTPAWNNLTTGNGTTAGWWTTIGDIAIVYAYIEFGSTSAMSTNPYFPISTNGLPTPSTYGEYHYISDVILEQVGVQTLRGLLKWRDGNIAPVAAVTSGTYMNQSTISSTVPFTWGTGDFLSILTMYRRA